MKKILVGILLALLSASFIFISPVQGLVSSSPTKAPITQYPLAFMFKNYSPTGISLILDTVRAQFLSDDGTLIDITPELTLSPDPDRAGAYREEDYFECRFAEQLPARHLYDYLITARSSFQGVDTSIHHNISYQRGSVFMDRAKTIFLRDDWRIADDGASIPILPTTTTTLSRFRSKVSPLVTTTRGPARVRIPTSTTLPRMDAPGRPMRPMRMKAPRRELPRELPREFPDESGTEPEVRVSEIFWWPFAGLAASLDESSIVVRITGERHGVRYDLGELTPTVQSNDHWDRFFEVYVPLGNFSYTVVGNSSASGPIYAIGSGTTASYYALTNQIEWLRGAPPTTPGSTTTTLPSPREIRPPLTTSTTMMKFDFRRF